MNLPLNSVAANAKRKAWSESRFKVPAWETLIRFIKETQPFRGWRQVRNSPRGGEYFNIMDSHLNNIPAMWSAEFHNSHFFKTPINWSQGHDWGAGGMAQRKLQKEGKGSESQTPALSWSWWSRKSNYPVWRRLCGQPYLFARKFLPNPIARWNPPMWQDWILQAIADSYVTTKKHHYHPGVRGWQ